MKATSSAKTIFFLGRRHGIKHTFGIHICILYEIVQATGLAGGASADRSRADTTQMGADTETDGDFTPAQGERNGSLTSNPQHITLKPAGQTKRDCESWDAARHLSRGAGKTANWADFGEQASHTTSRDVRVTLIQYSDSSIQ